MCAYQVPKKDKRMIDPLMLELQMVVLGWVAVGWELSPGSL